MRVADREVRIAPTFAEVGVNDPLLYESSYGQLALGVNGGSAAAVFGLAAGDEVVVRAT